MPSVLIILERLTKHRETVYLLLLSYYKGHNLGTAKWKRFLGQVYGGLCTQSSHALSTWPPFQYLDELTSVEVLQTLSFKCFYGGFITSAGLIINSFSSPSPLPRGWGGVGGGRWWSCKS